VASSRDLLDLLTVERMLAGVATRRHVDVDPPLGGELDGKAKATGRGSSVSRRWKRATEAAPSELMARDRSGLDVAVVMIDGLVIAEQCCLVALVITANGTKVPVGLWGWATPRTRPWSPTCWPTWSPRRLSAEGGLLVVIDGAKAPPPRAPT
jgi:putative transposase